MILYSLRSTTTGFLIAKFDDDFNVAETYEISTEGNYTYTCSCPGWPRKNKCKHTEMLKLFSQVGKVDSDWFYDYDKGDWHQPLETLDTGTDDHAVMDETIDIPVDLGVSTSSPPSTEPATFRRRV